MSEYFSVADAYNEAEQYDLEVISMPMQSRTALVRPDGLLAIDYSRIESEAEEKAILLEEIGHFCTYAFYPPDAPFNVWEKQEGRARRFVFEKHYPPCAIAKQMEKGNTEPWQLADALDLPERFVREMLKFYIEVRQVDFTVFAKLPKETSEDEKAAVDALLCEIEATRGISLSMTDDATVEDVLETLRVVESFLVSRNYKLKASK